MDPIEQSNVNHLYHIYFLKHTEDLLDGDGLVDGGLVVQHVESHGLGQGSALTDGHDVTFLHVGEGRGAVNGNVFVSFLVTLVFSDVVQIISSNDDGLLHFVGDNKTLEDTASNGDVSGEGTLLVNVAAEDSSLGGLETKANILEISVGLSTTIR